MPNYSVYLDDSGHPDDRPFVVAAGFLASDSEWEALASEWVAALKEHQLDGALHMTDFHGNSQEALVLERLTGIINAHAAAAFSCTVAMKSYRKVNADFPLEEGIGTPFAIVCRTVRKGINQWQRRWLKAEDTLTVYVERGTKHIGDMDEAFARDGFPKPLRAAKDHPAAQAADLFAWESFREATQGKKRRSLRNLVKGFSPTDRSKFLFEGIMREKELLHSVSEAALPPRKSLPDPVEYSYHSTPNRLRARKVY